MDEPLTNLDPPHQADWLDIVHALVAQGTTVVSVLHEVNMALHADAVVVMANGQVRHHGPSKDAHTHRVIEQVFENRIAIRQLDDQWVALPRRSTWPV
jgi:iron complex transport system ATP-binding protein